MVNSFKCQLFLQKALSEMLHEVLTTPLNFTRHFTTPPVFLYVLYKVTDNKYIFVTPNLKLQSWTKMLRQNKKSIFQ